MAIAGFLSKQTGKSQSLVVIFVVFSNDLEDEEPPYLKLRTPPSCEGR